MVGLWLVCFWTGKSAETSGVPCGGICIDGLLMMASNTGLSQKARQHGYQRQHLDHEDVGRLDGRFRTCGLRKRGRFMADEPGTSTHGVACIYLVV